MTSLICLALIALPQAEVPTHRASSRVPLGQAKIQRAGGLLTGFFLLEWDDAVDGKVAVKNHQCVIKIEPRGDEAFGQFFSLPGDPSRKATLVGRFDRGSNQQSVLSFRQIEGKYTCSYQMNVGAGPLTGVWNDSEGRGGDFRLTPAHDLLRSSTR